MSVSPLPVRMEPHVWMRLMDIVVCAQWDELDRAARSVSSH